jgi:hypothetical protein
MHNPYKYQVCSAGPFLASVVNGVLCGAVTEEPKQLCAKGKKNRAQIVCYVPSGENLPNMEVMLRCGGKDFRLGSLVRTGIVSGTFELPEPHFELFVREPVVRLKSFQEVQKMLTDVLQIFHDGKLNPSFGALRVGSLQTVVEAKNTFSKDLASLLKAQKDFCHCYKGKDDETWVVLHSHCKKVCIGYENTAPYAFLLADIVKKLGRNEVSLGDIFRWIANAKEFNGLLASNFTILKKFLIKYNTHFAWFQDDASKTTKVVLH